MSECSHTITQGREGATGSWCIACGVKIYEVHDRPCGECHWFKPMPHQIPICRRHHMGVTADMLVTYKIAADGPSETQGGLCFEAPSAPHDEAPDQFAENANCPIVGEAEVDRYER